MSVEHPPLWKNILAEGTAVARALNDLDSDGYEMVSVVHCGIRPQPNPLNNTVAIIPMFLVIAKRRFGTMPLLVDEVD